MPVRDSMMDDTAVRLALLPAVRLAGTALGPAVDTSGQNMQNYRVGMLVVTAGAITDGTHTVVLEHSDNGTTGWAAIPATSREGSLTPMTTAQQNTIQRMGFHDTKRYVRATATVAGGTTGGTVSAVILLSGGNTKYPTTG